MGREEPKTGIDLRRVIAAFLNLWGTPIQEAYEKAQAIIDCYHEADWIELTREDGSYVTFERKEK